jgi:hypothetical protein
MTEFKSFYASVIISVQQISGNENNKEIGLWGFFFLKKGSYLLHQIIFQTGFIHPHPHGVWNASDGSWDFPLWTALTKHETRCVYRGFVFTYPVQSLAFTICLVSFTGSGKFSVIHCDYGLSCLAVFPGPLLCTPGCVPPSGACTTPFIHWCCDCHLFFGFILLGFISFNFCGSISLSLGSTCCVFS